jgi:hypothetical protein
MTGKVRTVTVYDTFRQETPLRRRGRGEQVTVVLRGAATDGARHYVLHAYSRRIDDMHLTPLDVFFPGRDQPVRAYVGLSTRARLTRLTATAGGDLLIIDDYNEALLRLDAADIRALEGM